MTAPRPTLPFPPRLLSKEQAAGYVGLSPNQFEVEVEAGTFPPPVTLKKTRRRLWDRIDLDRALDARLTVTVESDGDGGYYERRRRWLESKDREKAARERNGPRVPL